MNLFQRIQKQCSRGAFEKEIEEKSICNPVSPCTYEMRWKHIKQNIGTRQKPNILKMRQMILPNDLFKVVLSELMSIILCCCCLKGVGISSLKRLLRTLVQKLTLPFYNVFDKYLSTLQLII